MDHYDLYLDGKPCPPSTGEYFESFDPYTGRPWAMVAKGGTEDVVRAIEAAHRAFVAPSWRGLSASARGNLLRRLGDLIAANAERLGSIETRDNGKLLAEMLGQVRYIPQWFYYYGGLADKIEGSVVPNDKTKMFTYTKSEPLGVVAAITPWNSPLLLAVWKLAPALAAGNTVVWKPSEFSSVSALEFVKLFDEAGFPPGVVNVVTGFGADIGETLVTHPLVAKIAFTGGESAGQRVNELAARHFKRITLELGGKSPNIVFADANLDNAVKGVISGIFAATGQTCIAGSRLLVQRKIHDAFVDKVVEFAGTARIGDPSKLETQVGPVTTRPQYDKVLRYIETAKSEGATCLLGGSPSRRPECGTGWFVEPTIFSGVTPEMQIAREEVFGPVLAVLPFEDDEEAVHIANSLPYGLAAGVWTENIGRALTMVDRLEAGTVWVNTYRAVSYMMPFGGYKRSGLGRENGMGMINEYLQTKSVWIDMGNDVPNPFVLR
ncbi:aldehyde dehydrogenase [Paralcaligenes sp. KSB-10]|uniref:aldehyde dehydrogenase n=1 Tax=Paralcaligenes sp. KSB-10 TaxID=2901142 RepID=UPI001E5CF7D2|nr:aldehyde dehydrogenase [Paralcaligenes sp. KSB-10]UHL63971.1 aldehyde dehydrogenase [Paralcaligenes sp. KSB-10]